MRARPHCVTPIGWILILGWWPSAYAAPSLTLMLGHAELRVEVAATPEEHRRGLMKRPRLPWNEGMLFVLGKPEAICLWMHDTHIALSAAFIDQTGGIVEIVDMTPRTEVVHCAREAVGYVLEVNQGWFRMNGLKLGDRVIGLSVQPPARR